MPFTPGLPLCADFYHQAVRPILDDAFPGLRHSAALIGPGSEVLGFDTGISADHHWGPRVMLFLEETDLRAHADHIFITLAERLPLKHTGRPQDVVDAILYLLRSDFVTGEVLRITGGEHL